MWLYYTTTPYLDHYGPGVSAWSFASWLQCTVVADLRRRAARREHCGSAICNANNGFKKPCRCTLGVSMFCAACIAWSRVLFPRLLTGLFAPQVLLCFVSTFHHLDLGT